VRARKCAFVAGGANLLHSIEKPRIAMRRFSGRALGDAPALVQHLRLNFDSSSLQIAA